MFTVFLDAGHGGDSPGASYKGRKEKDDTLRLCLALKKKLEKTGKFRVLLSRDDDVNPSITERCAVANREKADYFLSVHRNAFSPEKAQGAESWVKSSVKTDGYTYAYAKMLTDAAATAGGFINRGVKRGAPAYADYGVNRLTQMHSCLLELGFIDSTEDNERFDAHFDGIVSALCAAFMKIFGLDTKEKPTVDDARTALRAAIGLEKTSDDKKYDLDGDGVVTVEDARGVLRRALGLE